MTTTSTGILRDMLGMQQVELAQKAKLSRAMLSLIESGRRHGSHETRKRIAGALGVSVKLLDDMDQDEPKMAKSKQIQKLIKEREDWRKVARKIIRGVQDS